MGGDGLKPVKSGDSLIIPASIWNSVLGLIDQNQKNALGLQGGSAPSSLGYSVVTIKNNSGGDVSRFGVLGIDDPIITPTDNLGEFQSHPMLVCSEPSDADHVGRFVVLLEPLKNGEIGRAVVDGIMPAIVNITDTDHKRADIKDGSTTLESGSNGLCDILWIESGTGVKNAIIRFGASSNDEQPYKVSSVGADHLVCRLWDYDAEATVGSDVNIAKPYLLRETPFDGTTQNGLTYDYIDGTERNVDDGSDDEDQVIVPAYDVVDDNIIMAKKANTGVTVSSKVLTLLDSNNDGRAWAKKNG